MTSYLRNASSLGCHTKHALTRHCSWRVYKFSHLLLEKNFRGWATPFGQKFSKVVHVFNTPSKDFHSLKTCTKHVNYKGKSVRQTYMSVEIVIAKLSQENTNSNFVWNEAFFLCIVNVQQQTNSWKRCVIHLLTLISKDGMCAHIFSENQSKI